MRVTGLAWVGVGTTDYARTLRFFTETMGLEVETAVDRQAILRVGDDGQQLEIFGREGHGRTLNTPPTIAFEVDDVDSARDALIAGGAEIVGGIGEWAGHRWLYFRSPDGHLFEVKSSPKPTA